jgi:transposase InsO family protein
MSDEWTAADDAVEEVREIRRRIWERFDNDPEKYIAYLQQVHHQLLREGWVEAPPRPRQDKSAA